jgi:hypothetical protein
MRWSDIPFRPTSSTLRWFAGLGSAFLAGIGCWQLFVRENRLAASILLALAVVVAAIGIVSPMVLRPIFVGWMVLVYPLNWLISHLVLGVIYYCVFTPVAVFFKVIGRDSLARRFRPEQESYWSEKRCGAELRSYFRQS